MAWNMGLLGAAGGGAAGAFDLLETQVLTSSASSVTFTGLGSYSDYKHLQIRMAVRMDGTFTTAGLRINLNSDTAANYDSHILQGKSGSVTSVYSSSGFAQLQNTLPAGGSTANIFGGAVMDILDFSSSSKNTTMRTLSGVNVGSSSLDVVVLTSSLYRNTNAVTSINIGGSGLNFVTGSRFSLYGVK